MILDAETLELVNAIESLLEAAPSGEIKPELMESVLEVSTDPCAEHRPGGRAAARAAPAGGRDGGVEGPRDRLRRDPSVRDVGGPADRRPAALPRPDLGAAVRRPPGADLRDARPRRGRRPGQGDPRRQRDARAHAGAARAVGQLAVLARRRDRPRVDPDADLPRLPARRDPADVQGLGGLRAADRVHDRREGDRGLHLPVARRPPASATSEPSRSG